MTVGLVASASSGSQASVASFNISASLGTGARAGIVFVATHNTQTDIITGVTWNGVAMTRLYRAVDTDTEPGSVVAYFLDNVTNGAVTVSRTNNTVPTVGYAASLSASKATEAYQTITRVASTQNTNANTSAAGTGASGEVAVDDGSPGTSSLRLAAYYSGAATPPAQGTSSTALQVLDSTAYGSRFVCEQTAGQGSRNVGAATGTTDDWALVAVAVREVPVDNRNANIVNTGGGILTSVRVKGGQGAVADTGGGIYTHSYARSAKNADLIAALTGGGVVTVVGRKGMSYSHALTGGGIVTTSIRKGAVRAGALTGGGILTAVARKGMAYAHALTGGGVVSASRVKGGSLASIFTGGGIFTPSVKKGALVTNALTGGGIVTVTGSKATASVITLAGGGVVALSGQKGGAYSPTDTGGGVVTLDLSKQMLYTVAVTGGGVVTIDYFVPGGGNTVVVTGGGSVTIDGRGSHTSVVVATGGGVATLDVTHAHSTTITGMTRDGNGNPIPGCTVDLFRTDTNAFVGTTVSNGLGQYTIIAPPGAECFAVAYIDTRVGVSARDLVGVSE